MSDDELLEMSKELKKYKGLVSDISSFRPITGSFETEFEGEKDIIKGDALGVGTWNQIYYSEEELKKGASTLEGVSLVIGHGKKEADEVGKVTDAEWNPKREVIEFTATVDSEEVSQMIKRGVVDSVSVGVEFDDVMTDKGKAAQNISFYELALVNEPAFIDGIHEIIEKEAEEEELKRDTGGEELMAEKVILPLPERAVDELSEDEDIEVKGEMQYPGPAGYYPGYGYPGKYGYPGYGYPGYGYPGYGYPGYYGYPKASEKAEEQEDYGYPYGYGYPAPKLSSIVSMLLKRIRRIEKETDIGTPEYGKIYGYPEEEKAEEEELVAVEMEKDKAEDILQDISSQKEELSDKSENVKALDERLEKIEEELSL